LQPGTEGWGKEPEVEKGLLHTEMEGKIFRSHIPSERGNYMDFFDALHKCIVEDGPLPVTPGDASRVIRVIEAAFRSSSEKKVVPL
jgi:predicted dehydrogenase